MGAIDQTRVSGWLTDHLGGARPPFRFDLITGGRSNLTFRVTDSDGSRFVLRRPPTAGVLATAHDMEREHRLISAIGTTGVPVPRVLGLCTDTTVTGAPFYVMEFVDGEVLDSPEKAELLAEPLRAVASENLIDVLADLHAVDVDAVGLGDLARRDGYVERQIRRWTTQWERSATRPVAAVDEVARRLAERIPPQQGVVVAHGDYRFGNLLTSLSTGRIAAVLDWELCTLGDPLADLGYLGVYWAGSGRPRRHNDPTAAGGFWSYPEIVAHYAERTGRDVSSIDYYVAFSAFRLAVISEGVYARYVNLAMADQPDPEVVNEFRDAVDELATSALAALDGGA